MASRTIFLRTVTMLVLSVLVVGAVPPARAEVLMFGDAPSSKPGPIQASIVRILSQGEPEILVTIEGAFESLIDAPDGRQYSYLSIPGCGVTAEDIGYPAMPFKGFFLEIPYGVDVSVELVDYSVRSLGRGYIIYPKQPEPLDIATSEPPFEINREAYATDAFFPASPVVIDEPGFIRGRRVVFVEVFPLQYNPVSTELRGFSSLRFQLKFIGTPDKTGEARKKRLATKQSEALAEGLITNYEPIGPEESRGGEGGVGMLSSRDGADYLIIVADNLYEEILPLAEWKHKKGFITYVADMSEVGSTASDVEDYIQDAYDTWDPAPSYVLLVGDSGDVPSHYKSIPGDPNYPWAQSCTSDHVYACVDGDDMYADLTIARLPVHTGTECNDVVEKILTYDRDPNTGNWYESFLSAAYFQGHQTASRAYMQTLAYMKDFLEDSRGMIAYTAWTTTSTYDPNFQSTGSWDPNYVCYYRDGTQVPQEVTDLWEIPSDATDSVIDAINAGVGLVEHRDHGGITGWSYPSFTNSHISNNLDNGDMTPVVFSINCSTGSFQYGPSGTNDCFCEAFIKKSGGGCVGFVGPTRTSPTYTNNELINGINTCFWPSYDPNFAYKQYPWYYEGGDPFDPNYDPNDNIYALSWRPAEALNYGKYHVLGRMGNNVPTEGEFYMYHYFGDPEMMLRTETPEALSVSHIPAVIPDTPMDVTVTVTKDGNSLEGALVAITHRSIEQDYWTGYTDANGSVTFSDIIFHEDDPNDPNDYDIVVTAHNCIPYEGVIFLSGGAISIDLGSPVITNCIITDNSCGIYCYSGSPTITNCTITNNTATSGGGIYCYDASPTITNCTITNNTATSGGGIYCYDASPTITNCIFWGNEGSQIHPTTLSSVTYCDVQGGYPDPYNIDADPCFVNAANPAGPDGIFGTADDGLCLRTDSPCIDTGYNQAIQAEGIDTDIIDNVRIVDGNHAQEDGIWATVDMGAYELPVIWYVDDNVEGETHNGKSWATAYDNLQDALTDENIKDGNEIWVADGNYYPDEGSGQTPNDPGASFVLTEGVGVYGGFDGGETARIDRDWTLYEATLSGDINTPDSNDNSYHVVTGADDAILDGFTITDGNADGLGADRYGGGIYCSGVSPTISNCVIEDNNSSGDGGGMYNGNSSPTLINCTFSGNTTARGGGMYNFNSSVTLTNCVFTGNNTDSFGGGMCNNLSSLTVTNCTFSGNSTDGYGGGMFNIYSSPTVTNCIFWGNDAGIGDEVFNAYSNPTFSYCDVNGCGGSDNWDPNFGTDGGGNIDSDPCFVDIDNPDGNDGIFGTLDDGLRLLINSPCIDAADGDAAPATDILGHVRANIPGVDNTGRGDPNYADIGAYEYPPVIVVMVWIDESGAAYYSDDYDSFKEKRYNTDLANYRNVINSVGIVKSGCLVPLPSGGKETFYTIEGVLPIDYFGPRYPEPPVPEYVNPDDPPAGISIYPFPRETDPELTLDTFKNHFKRICDGVVPDYLCLSVDNSGSMETYDIEPHFSQQPEDNFIDWIEDNYSGTTIKRRYDPTLDEFDNEQWVDEMVIQVQSVLNEP